MLVLVIIILHLAYLHSEGSSNPVARLSVLEKSHFYYYYSYKDLYFFLVTIFFLFLTVFLFPNVFNHPDNFNEANPLVTPSHIVPEWYFLPFYAISRAIPNKLLGVLAMLLSIIFLFVLPFLSKISNLIESNFQNLILSLFFYILLLCFLVLGYLGSMPAEAPYVFMSQFFTALYFFNFTLPTFSSFYYNIYKKFSNKYLY